MVRLYDPAAGLLSHYFPSEEFNAPHASVLNTPSGVGIRHAVERSITRASRFRHIYCNNIVVLSGYMSATRKANSKSRASSRTRTRGYLQQYNI